MPAFSFDAILVRRRGSSTPDKGIFREQGGAFLPGITYSLAYVTIRDVARFPICSRERLLSISHASFARGMCSRLEATVTDGLS
ncbi:MAG: hypothetical protein H8F28_14595 [Fibrella sp.]|nr:hypothetical protein [Armatimonadota bacterium]